MKSFFGYPFFYYDFFEICKNHTLVDQLTFVAIKNNIMLYT